MSLSTTLVPTTETAIDYVSTPRTWIIHADTLLCVETGELKPAYYLQSILRHSLAGGFIVGTHLYQEIGSLTEVLSDLPGWQLRTSIIPQTKGLLGPGGKPAMRGTMMIDYLTFTSPHLRRVSKVAHGRGQRRVRWRVINLEAFLAKPVDTLEAKRDAAIAIVGMAKRRGISLRPTRGGMAAAMLKASPLWLPTLTAPDGGPCKRRYPAPAFINERAREELPGNHYSVIHGRLGSPTSMTHCYLVDQNSAHHTIAATIPLPHPEHIHARGNSRGSNVGWVKPDSEIGQQIESEHIGLVCALIQVSHIPIGMAHLYPKWAQKPGMHIKWLWTPELRLFKSDHRVSIVHYISTMTTTKRDLALQEYALWAMSELELPGKEYKKSTLLAAYGILATNTHARGKAMFAWAGTKPMQGDSMYLPLLGDVIVRKIGTPEGMQPRTLNVAARGVIEAETRTRSLEYARAMTAQGIEVAQVYVDGLLLNTHKLPFIREGWRVAHSLTDVTIPQINGFRSNELVKLPGIPRDRAVARDSARAPFEFCR